MIELYVVIAAFLGSMLAGMFGGGAGLIFTPTIFVFLSYVNPHAHHIMQTSITTMIAALMLSGLVGIFKYHRYKYIDWIIIKWSAPCVVIGAIAGCFLMTLLSSQIVNYIFAMATLVLAVKLTFQIKKSYSLINFKLKVFFSLLLGVISTVSGSASFFVPFYERIGLDIKKAIGTTTVIVWCYSAFVVIFMIFLGLKQEHLPSGNIGFLNYKYLLLFMLPTIPGVLLGAKLAHLLEEKILKKAFICLLYLIGISMLLV